MANDPRIGLAALNRFGLGARPGDPALVAADPKGFVKRQLARRADLALGGRLPDSHAGLLAHRTAELARMRERAQAQPVKSTVPPVEDDLLRSEVAARFARAASVEGGLLERLVLFWSNHFAISQAKGNHVKVLMGPFEREAIRPFVLGRFADMLRAVETHPAMLFYLDANQSTGPASRTGLTQHKGLNENLAREILELHTLGVDGGYTQADVTAFARVITGWTVVWPDDDALFGGRFTFAPARHEPGAQSVLGRIYAEDDEAQGLAVLDDLARRPATARHIARKLAAHFVADVPPPALVARLEAAFRSSDGDLGVLTRALIDAPEAWTPELEKVRTPVDFLIAGLRMVGAVPDGGLILGALSAMGQRLWEPPGPNGWGDAIGDWAAPRAFDARLDLAAEWGRRNQLVEPMPLLDRVLGAAASAETRAAVGRAESRGQGLALLQMAPEVQRR